MALTADYTVSERIGEGTLSVSFTDTSTGGVPTYWKWLLGDGTVIEGAAHSTIGYTYRAPGTYSPTLIVNDGASQASVQKTDHIIVNVVYPRPLFVIMQSFSVAKNNYWRLYFDSYGYLFFEDKDYLYRSTVPIISVKKWNLVELHTGILKMFIGSMATFRKEISYIIIPNTAPLSVTVTKTEIAPNSTIKLDELKIWARETNLNQYFMDTRGKAGMLDLS